MDNYAVSVVGRYDGGWESITAIEDGVSLAEAKRAVDAFLGAADKLMGDYYHELEIVLWDDSIGEPIDVRRAYRNQP